MQTTPKHLPPPAQQRTLDVIGGALVTLVIGAFVLAWGAMAYLAL
ncbi:MAG: hypothetical protein RLW61_21215 [Gammaproteobacteria bacterium]